MAKAQSRRSRKHARGKRRRQLKSTRPRQVRLRLEQLEDRTAPSAVGTIDLSFPDTSTLYQTVRVSEALASPNDVAMNRVSLNAGDLVTAQVDASAAGGSLNSYLRVFQESGGSLTPIAASDNYQGQNAGLTFQAPVTGFYDIGVSSSSNTSYNPLTPNSGVGASSGPFELSLAKAPAPLAPDLVGASLATSSSQVVWGDTITVNYRVENRGGLAAPATTVALLPSANNQFNDALSPLQSASIPALAAGASYSGAFTVQLGATGSPLTPFEAPGQIFLGLQIGSALPDSSEQGNDWAPIEVLETGAIPAPGSNPTLSTAAPLDLNSRTSDVSLVPGSEGFYRLTLTQSGNLTATVHATGAAATLGLYDAGGMPIVQSDGQSATDPDPLIAQGLTGDSAGTSYYLKVVDADGQDGAYSLTVLFTPSASALPTIPLGASTQMLAEGDFNGDGLTDLVSGNWNYADGRAADNVTVLLNNGDGTFRAAETIDLAFAPTTLVVGAFTGNGQLDIVASAVGANGIQVLLGNGDGTFQSPVTLPLEGGNALAAGDFNGDGELDLAVGNSYTDTVNVLLGNGDGTFRAGQSISLPAPPLALAVGDFAGDGLLDLAVAEGQSNSVTILVGDGDGTFAVGGSFAVGASPNSIVAADLAGNGRLDLATANAGSNSVTVLLGNGDATFQAGHSYAVGNTPLALTTADINGDGALDLITANAGANSLSVLLGNGDGMFLSAESIPVGPGPVSVVAGDFLGDGRVDLASGNYEDKSVTILLNNGMGEFPQPTTSDSTGRSPGAEVTGDFTGDGRLDIAVTNRAAGTVTILLGQGDGTFQNAGSFAAGAEPVALAVGDFNGDGRLDLAVADYSSNYGPNPGPSGITILLGNGVGGFVPGGFYPLAGEPSSIVAGDFNDDGNLDLAVAITFNADFSLGNRVELLLGNGLGQFTPGPSFTTGLEPVALVAGDFNGDGQLDLATANNYSQSITVLMGDGTGHFPTSATYLLGASPYAMTVGDFSGDGRLDLAVATENSAGVIVLLNQGDGAFAVGPSQSLAGIPSSIVAGDFTGDGHVDLAVASAFYPATYEPSNTITILLGNGDGTFQTGSTLATGSSPSAMVAGDFNGDGYLDLAAANYESSTISVFLGEGGGQFVAPTLAPAPVESTPLVANFTGTTTDAVTLSASGQILYRRGLANDPGSFAPPVVLNPDPLMAARDLAQVQTDSGVPMLAALDANALVDPNNPTAGPVPQVTLYLPHPDGTFTTLPGLDLPAGFLPADIASADLTGDGLGDLIITGATSDDVYVSLQTSPGVFAPATAYSVGVNPSAIELTDVNGDGRIDIEVVDQFSGQVSVLLNDGNNVFSPEERYRADGGLYGLAPVNGAQGVQSLAGSNGLVAGPFTGGPGNDLIVANSGSGDITLLPSAGSGGFLNPQLAFTDSGGEPTAVVSGYFISGDDNLDLAVLDAATDTISIYRGDGSGNFTLIAPAYNAGNDPTGLAVADVSRPGGGGPDGIPDLLVSNSYGDLLILTGNGDGTFSQYERASQTVSLAASVSPTTGNSDFYFSNQGNDQLAYASAPSGAAMVTDATVYQNRSAGIQAPGPETIATVDGVQYLLVLNSGANELLVYSIGSDGAPIAASAQTYYTGTDPVSLAVTNATDDLNGDNVPDVVVADQGSNDVCVYVGQIINGQWSLNYRSRQSSGGIGPTSVAVVPGPNGELPEVLVSNSGSNDVSVLQDRGNGFFVNSGQLFQTGENTVQILTGDFNDNGQLDVVTVNSGSNNITFIADFQSNPVTTTIDTGGVTPATALVAEFDGVSSLLVANVGNGTLELLSGVGFDDVQTLPQAAAPYYSGLAAVSDGNQLDIYGAYAGSETAVLLDTLGISDHLVTVTVTGVPGFPQGLEIAESNNDFLSVSTASALPLVITGLTLDVLNFTAAPPGPSSGDDQVPNEEGTPNPMAPMPIGNTSPALDLNIPGPLNGPAATLNSDGASLPREQNGPEAGLSLESLSSTERVPTDAQQALALSLSWQRYAIVIDPAAAAVLVFPRRDPAQTHAKADREISPAFADLGQRLSPDELHQAQRHAEIDAATLERAPAVHAAASADQDQGAQAATGFEAGNASAPERSSSLLGWALAAAVALFGLWRLGPRLVNASLPWLLPPAVASSGPAPSSPLADWRNACFKRLRLSWLRGASARIVAFIGATARAIGKRTRKPVGCAKPSPTLKDGPWTTYAFR
jgi:hypothetical protein